jgi:hypothetical protein
MSDYLWDKSCEPEADVERLEELLGRLRHVRHAPELPFEVGMQASSLEVETHASELEVNETHASTRASFIRPAAFSRPARLAVAAVLLLAVTAGAFVMLRSSSKGDGRAASNATQVAQPQVGATVEARAPEAAASASKQSVAPEQSPREIERRGAQEEAAQSLPKEHEQRRDSSPEAASNGPAREVFKTVASVPNRSRVDARLRATRAGFDGGAFDVQSRVRAKEQLVYAMRLTSEALKEVRGRASGADARANAFDGRSPLR